MTREELIAIGKRIINCECTKDEIDALQDLFSSQVPHPSGASLFFYPENYDSRTMDISTYQPSVENVVDLCLAYRPIQL